MLGVSDSLQDDHISGIDEFDDQHVDAIDTDLEKLGANITCSAQSGHRSSSIEKPVRAIRVDSTLEAVNRAS